MSCPFGYWLWQLIMPVAFLELRVGPGEVLWVGVVLSEGLGMATRTVVSGTSIAPTCPFVGLPHCSNSNGS